MAKLHRKGFRDREAPAPTIARNQGAARGRPVTLGDVAPFRRPLHQPCAAGRGTVVRKGRREACACATKRFLRAHPELILDARGNAWWPAEPPV